MRSFVILVSACLLSIFSPLLYGQSISAHNLFLRFQKTFPCKDISDSTRALANEHKFLIEYHGFSIKATTIWNDSDVTSARLDLPSMDTCAGADSMIRAFIGRTFLFALAATPLELKSELEDNHVVISGGQSTTFVNGVVNYRDMLPVLLNATSFSIQSYINEGKAALSGYKAVFTNSQGQSVILSFPARADIILGLEKIQLDSLIFSMLCRQRPANGSGFTASGIKHTVLETDTMAVREDSAGIMKTVPKFYEGYECCRFLIRKDSTLAPVFAEKFPRQSINNVMQGVIPAWPAQIRVQVQNYLKKETDCTVNLSDLYYLLAGGCEVYCATEEKGVDRFLTTVLYINRQLNYLHLLYFPWGTGIIENPGSILSGRLYGFIRLDNVDKLNGEYREQNSEFKVKIK